MSTLYFRQSRLLILTIGIILVGGLASLSGIPRQEDPTLTNRFAAILTPFPGASADRVETLVTEPIEDELREISEIETITSTSRNGISVVTVELLETIADPDPFFSEIRDALNDAAAAFPEGVGDSIFDNDRGPPAYTLIVGLTWQRETPPNLSILGRLAEDLQNRMRNVPNTQLVDLYGEPDEEIRVEIDPGVLTSLGLTAEDVAQAISGADAKVSAGQLRGSVNDLLIEVTGELDTLSRVRSVPLIDRAGGTLVRVGDVARVERGVVDPPSTLALVDGRGAVVIAAQMAADRRVDLWSDGMRALVAEYQAELPDGVDVELIFDQSAYTETRLDGLMQNLMIGAGLVLLVLFITLGWRAALIVGSALPLTSLIALTTLNFTGIPIHQMSVTGLIVALGLLVDSAIVMTDAVQSRRARGVPALRAVAEASAHLWLPLLTSTVTTILAFMPIALLPGGAGEFVGPIAFSVMIALVSSYFVAMTIVPALAGRFVKGGDGGRRPGFLSQGLTIPALARLFSRSIALSLRHPRLSIMAAIVPSVLGFVGMTTLTEQFFPPADRNQFHIELSLPAQTSIHETRRVTERAYDLITDHEAIESVHWFVGTDAPKFYYNLQTNQDGVSSYAEAQVTARSLEDAQRLIPILQQELDVAFPRAQVLVRELLQGPPVDAPIELRIYGPDPDRLRELGEQACALLTRVDSVTHARSSLEGGEPKVWVQASEETARLTGLGLVDLARQLDATLEGAVGGSIVEGTEELPVRVRVANGGRDSLDSVASLALTSPLAVQGSPNDFPGIPLTAVGQVSIEPERPAITRRNGERINTITGFVEWGVLPETALMAFQELLATEPIDLPSGYRFEFGGDSAERNEAVGNLSASLGLIVTLSIAIIVLTFNSFRYAAVIGLVAFLSMGLGLLSLTAVGHPFGFTAIIGLLGLVGVAINAAIIILSALKADPAALAGDQARIRDVVVTGTSRHIVSTTITTFGGFLPLILSEGGFWPPFAVVIAGGVVLSTIVSFYLVPAMFRLMNPVRRSGTESAMAPVGAPA